MFDFKKIMVDIVENNPDIVRRVLRDNLKIEMKCTDSFDHDVYTKKMHVKIVYAGEVICKTECNIE